MEIDGNYVRYLTSVSSTLSMATSATLTSAIAIPPQSYGDFLIVWGGYAGSAGRSLYLYNTSDSAKLVLQVGITSGAGEASAPVRTKVNSDRKLNYYASNSTGTITLYTNGYCLNI